MAFGNPVTSLPATAITPGALPGGVTMAADGVTSGALAATFTLTGTIRTAATGARVEVDSAGVRAYDAGGANTFALSSADGSVSIIGGHLTTSAAGHRWELRSSPANQLLAYTGDAGELTPGYLEVSIITGGTTAADRPLIALQPPVIGTYASGGLIELVGSTRDGTGIGYVLITGDLQLNSGQISCLATGSVLYFPNGNAAVKNASVTGTLTAPTLAGNVAVGGALSIGSGLTMNSYNAGIEIGSTGTANTPFIDMHSSGAGGDYDVRLLASGGTGAGNGALNIYANQTNIGPLTLSGNTLYSTGDIGFQPSGAANGSYLYKKVCLIDVYNNTSTSAGNVLIATNPQGFLYRSTASSRRWKRDIDQLGGALDPAALLRLPVRQYRFRDDYLAADDERHGKLVPGFIAEEMDELYPVAVDHDPDGLAHDWNPRLLIPAMLALIQRAHTRLDTLEGRPAA